VGSTSVGLQVRGPDPLGADPRFELTKDVVALTGGMRVPPFIGLSVKEPTNIWTKPTWKRSWHGHSLEPEFKAPTNRVILSPSWRTAGKWIEHAGH